MPVVRTETTVPEPVTSHRTNGPIPSGQSRRHFTNQPDTTMKNVIFLCLLCLFAVSCGTKYEEFAANGQPLYKFSTYGNLGIATDKLGEDGSSTRGIPLLGGGYQSDTLTEAKETHSTPPSITIGENFSITGTLDHSTPTDAAGHHVVQGVKSMFRFLTYWKGLDVFEGIETGSQAKDVAINDSNNEVLNEGLKQNSAIQQKALNPVTVPEGETVIFAPKPPIITP